MKTWTEIKFDLEETMPCVTAQVDSVAVHTPGYDDDNEGNRGLSVRFYARHIPILEQVIEYLRELDTTTLEETRKERQQMTDYITDAKKALDNSYNMPAGNSHLYTLDAIANSLIAIAETFLSIDSNLEIIREVATSTEAGDRRLEEIRAAIDEQFEEDLF